MSLMVTPYTKINFRLYDYSTFKKDALLGEVCLDFYSVLKNIVAVVTSWTSAWTCGSVTARTGQVRAIQRLAPYTSFCTDSR